MIWALPSPLKWGNQRWPPFCCFPLRILKTRPIGCFPTTWGQLLPPPSPILQLRWLPPSTVWQRHCTREKPTLFNSPVPAITSALSPLRPFDWQWYGRRQALSSGKSASASLLLFPPPHSKNAAHRLFPHSMGTTSHPTVTHLAIALAFPSPFSRLAAAPHQRKTNSVQLPCPAITSAFPPAFTAA